MKKVAIFTEGQGELIFVRHLLFAVFGYGHFSLECSELRADRLDSVPYNYLCPTAVVHFQIINVRNDERVISTIKQSEANLIKQGFDQIIGLRDMYSEAYRKKARDVDKAVIEFITQSYEKMIQGMNNAEKIQVFFAIMELEAWLLAMYNLFPKIDAALTCSHIEKELGFDLQTINPETEFFQPARKLGTIFNLVGREYDKTRGLMESILSNMDKTDIDTISENGRCPSFALFLTAVTESTMIYKSGDIL